MTVGEFGNLIAGDERSSPRVQLLLLHSKVRFRPGLESQKIC